MNKTKELETLINEYEKSIIQSEAEVRSKLIVPLLDCLEYPSELRAEEFPVYGFEGSNKIPAKNADFILFTDKTFGSYRTFTQRNIEWVQNHSLLVVEAKKPGEMPEVLGQPVYYTIWTKAVAYLAIDGKYVKGYYYNDITADRQVINCEIRDLSNHKEIWNFSYQNISSIKKNGIAINETDDERIIKEAITKVDSQYEILTSDDDINLPEETLSYMKYALGRNAEGLGKLQLVSRFLNMTDTYLQCKMRYDIPQYMFDIPREIRSAFLYTDDSVMPLIKGEIIKFFWNDYEKFTFSSEYIEAIVIYESKTLIAFEIGFHVLDRQVSARLSNFETVKKCVNANVVRILIEDLDHTNIVLPSGRPGSMWESKPYITARMDFWIAGLEKMRVIENYYDFEFHLKHIEGRDTLNKLYDAIDFVYDGIVMNQNCEITICGGFSDEDLILTEPVLYQKDVKIPLNDQIIHDVIFRPYISALLPGTIHVAGTSNNDIIRINACCLYKKIDSEK